MAVTSSADVSAALRAMGWRTRTAAETTRSIADYQRGYNLGAALEVDGKAGPKTKAALTKSLAAGGKISAHFAAKEFACHCGGAYASCRRIWMTRKQLVALEKYRAKVGAVSVVSGCRCVGHNRAVGGATASQHMVGTATDVPGRLAVSTIRALKVFTGIGYDQSTGKVVHVDTRPGSVSSPTIWLYQR